MIQILLILGIVSIVFDGAWGGGVLAVGAWAGGLIIGAPLLLLFGVAWACGQAGESAIDKGDIAACRRAERALLSLRILGAAWYCGAVMLLGWLHSVREFIGDIVLLDELVALAPLVLYLAGLLWASYPIEDRIRTSVLWRDLHRGLPVYPPLSRGAALWQGVRHHMLLVLVPVALILTWSEVYTRWVQDLPIFDTAPAPIRTFTRPAVYYAGVFITFSLSPLIIATLWDTVRLRSGPLVDRLRAMCRAYRVRVSGPYVWRTGGSMINGAILGFFWPARYLLLTDGLLDRLQDDQIESVLAHEIAHVKHRHLPWLGASLIATALTVGWLGTFTSFWFGFTPETAGFEVALSLITLAAALSVFGFVSRRFEWQADAFAARHLSVAAHSNVITPEAVSTMAGALGAVADLNGVPVESLSWRHGSISLRQNRLRAMIGQPVDNMRIDRTARWIKVLALLTLLITAGPLVYAALELTGG